jgi:hypothetical protein
MHHEFSEGDFVINKEGIIKMVHIAVLYDGSPYVLLTDPITETIERHRLIDRYGNRDNNYILYKPLIKCIINFLRN